MSMADSNTAPVTPDKSWADHIGNHPQPGDLIEREVFNREAGIYGQETYEVTEAVATDHGTRRLRMVRVRPKIVSVDALGDSPRLNVLIEYSGDSFGEYDKGNGCWTRKTVENHGYIVLESFRKGTINVKAGAWPETWRLLACVPEVGTTVQLSRDSLHVEVLVESVWYDIDRRIHLTIVDKQGVKRTVKVPITNVFVNCTVPDCQHVTYLDNGEKIKWHQRQVPYVLDGIYPGMQRVRYGKLTGVLTSVRKPKHGAYNHFVYMMIRNQEGGHLQVTILKEDLSRLVSDGRVNCSGVEIEFLKGWQNEQKPDQEKPDDNPGKKPRSNDDGLLRIFQNSCLAVGSDCRPQVVREYLWIVLKSAKSLGFIDFDEEKLKSRCLPKPSDGASSAPDSAQFVLPFKEPGASPNEFNAADAAAHVMTEARKIMVQQYRSETLEKLRNLPTVDLLALIDDCSPLNQAGALKIAQDEFKRRLGIG